MKFTEEEIEFLREGWRVSSCGGEDFDFKVKRPSWKGIRYNFQIKNLTDEYYKKVDRKRKFINSLASRLLKERGE